MTDSIVVSGLTKRLGDDFSLCDVSLRVEEGSVVGFIGANGAGKTSTLRAILGLMRLDAGFVEVFGEPFGIDASDAACKRVKERIGLVLDTCPFPSDLRVRDVAALMRLSYPRWSDEAFTRLVDAFGLLLKTRVKELSRGMGMKLQIACALAHTPDLLILDEATAGLDPLAREEVLGLLRDYLAEDERRSILMSSHITADLEKIADRVVCIDAGRVVFDVEKDEISDMAGVARCRSAEFDALAQSGAFEQGSLRFVRNAYGVDVLVPDRFAFVRQFPEIVCDKATIDDYMQLVLKGETR